MQTRKRKYATPPAPSIKKPRRAPVSKLPMEDFIEDINYSSYFFRKDLISDFSAKLRRSPDNYLSKYDAGIYNADDLLENLDQRGTSTTRALMAANRRLTHQERVNNSFNINVLVKALQQLICSDSIGANYARASAYKGVQSTYIASSTSTHYDIIVLSSRQIENYVPPAASAKSSHMSVQSPIAFNTLGSLPSSTDSHDSNYFPDAPNIPATADDILFHRLRNVFGFMVVEYGECKMFPNTYSVNLICTKHSAPKGAGSILMGAYLHTVLSHPMTLSPKLMIKQDFTPPLGQAKRIMREIKLKNKDVTYEPVFVTDEPLIPVDHRAVLELAGSYRNPGGLCTYEKFGFMYDSTMHGPHCYSNYRLLPMMIDLNAQPGYRGLTMDEKKQKIVDIALGKTSFTKSMICNLHDKKIVDGKIKYTWEQTLLGCLKILKIYLDQGKRDLLDREDLQVQELLPEVEIFTRTKNMTIENLISHLETPESQRRPLNLETLVRNVRDIEEPQLPSPPAPGSHTKYKKPKPPTENKKSKTSKRR